MKLVIQNRENEEKAMLRSPSLHVRPVTISVLPEYVAQRIKDITIKVESFGKTNVVLHKCQFRTVCSDPFLAPIIMKSGLVLPFP